MNKNLKVFPKDIQKYCVNKVLKRIIPCVLMFAVLLVAIILWGDILIPLDSEYVGLKRFCYLVILSIPFIVTRVPIALFDRTYCGTVKKVDIETTPETYHPAEPTLETVYMKNTIYLSIETPNGKKMRKKVYTGRANDAQHLSTFKEGDKVFHLCETKHTIILPTLSSTHCTCAVCGSVNEISNAVCYQCKHTLVKEFENKNHK
ncbi:MAG: hypothetical protein IIW63_05270 [Clostridia bacterium]|nr:hypothetical protein [Clostridia bacterium]